LGYSHYTLRIETFDPFITCHFLTDVNLLDVSNQGFLHVGFERCDHAILHFIEPLVDLRGCSHFNVFLKYEYFFFTRLQTFNLTQEFITALILVFRLLEVLDVVKELLKPVSYNIYFVLF